MSPSYSFGCGRVGIPRLRLQASPSRPSMACSGWPHLPFTIPTLHTDETLNGLLEFQEDSLLCDTNQNIYGKQTNQPTNLGKPLERSSSLIPQSIPHAWHPVGIKDKNGRKQAMIPSYALVNKMHIAMVILCLLLKHNKLDLPVPPAPVNPLWSLAHRGLSTSIPPRSSLRLTFRGTDGLLWQSQDHIFVLTLPDTMVPPPIADHSCTFAVSLLLQGQVSLLRWFSA